MLHTIFSTEFSFMAHHPVAVAVAAVGVGLCAFLGYRSVTR